MPWFSFLVQSVFRLEMYQNKIFSFKKIIFDISTSKRFKNIKKIYIKKFKILKNIICIAFLNALVFFPR
jgi:hypothetical protein